MIFVTRKVNVNQLPINFISSKDSDETRSMLTKSENIDIMMGSETDDFIEELCEFLLEKYYKELEELMSGTNYYFGSVG